MKTINKNEIIVAFHIGRGGRFNNAGHKTFIGEHPIGHFTDDLYLNYDLSDITNRMENEIEDWDEGDTDYSQYSVMTKKAVFLDLINEEKFEELEKMFGVKQSDLGEKQYYDSAGNPVGLTEKEAELGIGCINIDHDYDSTYTCYLSDCSEEELEIISESNAYKSLAMELFLEENTVR